MVALLVGCGLGRDKETAAFIKSLLSRAEDESERHMGFAFRAQERGAEHEGEQKALLRE